MMTTGNGNKSNVCMSGCSAPTRLIDAFCHFLNASVFTYGSIVCFNPFSAASKSPHSLSGYNKFNTITAEKLSKPCGLIGTFIKDTEFDKLPNSQTLQTCFCMPCPAPPPVRRPNEYSKANVGLIVSERSRKLFIIDVLP